MDVFDEFLPNSLFILQNMQLMYEHLTTLADLNKRHDSLFNETNELRKEIVKFKVRTVHTNNIDV